MEKPKEIAEYEESFDQDVKEIVAATGANGFSGGKTGAEKYWSASMELLAWKEKDGGPVHEGGSLEAKVEDAGLRRLQGSVKVDSIVRAKVRCFPGWEGRFLLAGRPRPAKDKELGELLAQRLRPVYYDDVELGRFMLVRTVGIFEKKQDWLGKIVNVSFDQDEEEEMEDALRTAHALFKEPEEWNKRLLEKACEDLLELKNDCWLDDEEEEMGAEEFKSRLELEGIEVCPEGEFCFWFGDGDLFWGHAVTVRGTIQDGPEEADMEG